MLLTSVDAGHAEAPKRVLLQAESLAKRQLEDLTSIAYSIPDRSDGSRGWEQGVFWVGMTALAEQSPQSWVRKAILAMGQCQPMDPWPEALSCG